MNRQRTIYFTLPMQAAISLGIKKPILDSIEKVSNIRLSTWRTVVVLWYLWKVYRKISLLPEPTKDNTWHPNTHKIIGLRDWLFERCFLGDSRDGFIRRTINSMIVLYDYDPPWRWIIDSLIKKALTIEWEERGYEDKRSYSWWRE